MDWFAGINTIRLSRRNIAFRSWASAIAGYELLEHMVRCVGVCVIGVDRKCGGKNRHVGPPASLKLSRAARVELGMTFRQV